MTNKIAAGLAALLMNCQPVYKEIVLSPGSHPVSYYYEARDRDDDAQAVAMYVKANTKPQNGFYILHNNKLFYEFGITIAYDQTNVRTLPDNTISTDTLYVTKMNSSRSVFIDFNRYIDFNADGRVDSIIYVPRGREGDYWTATEVQVSKLNYQTQKEINVEYGLLLKQIREAKHI